MKEGPFDSTAGNFAGTEHNYDICRICGYAFYEYPLDLRIKLGTGIRNNIFCRLVGHKPLPVYPVCRKGIIDIGNGNNTGQIINFLAFQPAGISFAIPVLVMVKGNFGYIFVNSGSCLKYLTVINVFLYQFIFTVGQFCRFIQNIQGYFAFAYIMQYGTHCKVVQYLRGKPPCFSL